MPETPLAAGGASGYDGAEVTLPRPEGSRVKRPIAARRAAGIYLAAIALVAVCLRILDLVKPSLWFDEGGSLSASSGSSLKAVVVDLAYTTHGDHFQPLYFILLHAWRSVFGSAVLSLRMPSVLLGLATLVLLTLVAARVFGWVHGVLTAALVATSAFFVMHAQEARPYSLLLLLTALLVYLFVRVREQRATRPFPPAAWALWACFGVAFFGSVLVALFVAGLAVGDLVIDRHLRPWLRTWLPCAAAALPSLAFFVLFSAAANPSHANVTQLNGSLARNAVFSLYGMVAGTTYGPPIERLHGAGTAGVVLSYWPSLLMLGLAMAGAIVGALLTLRSDTVSRDERSMALILVVAFVVSYILMAAFAAVAHMNWQPRHSFFLAVPTLLLLPLAARTRTGRGRSPWPVIGRVSLGLLLLANVYSLSHYYWDQAYARDDYRGVAQYISAHHAPGTRSVLLYGVLELLEYYGDDTTVEGDDLPQDHLAEAVRARTDDSPVVYLVSNREWAFWRQPESIEQAMAPGYWLLDTVSYPYFEIYRFGRR